MYPQPRPSLDFRSDSADNAIQKTDDDLRHISTSRNLMPQRQVAARMTGPHNKARTRRGVHLGGGDSSRPADGDFMTLAACADAAHAAQRQVRAAVQQGVCAQEAARITAPVFLAFGGTADIAPDPRAEPTGYPRSQDITVTCYEDMAHMHNFARTRAIMWRRFHDWTAAVTAGPRL
jgi:hypothetical protein